MQKFLLFLVGIICPIFIACAYGPGLKYDKHGFVKDKDTGVGIPNIRMSLDCDQRNQRNSDISNSAGFFEIWYNTPCQEMTYTDTDGAGSGGDYGTGQVPFDKNAAELLVELAKK